MSHFAVLVVTDERPTEEVLRPILQPWHEFECTGTDDEYVRDVDVTEEARKEYAASTRLRFRDPKGKLHDPWKDRFYRDPTAEETKQIGVLAGTGGGNGLSWTSRDWGDGKGYRTKIHECPSGWQEVRIPASEAETFLAFVKGYYGTEALGQDAPPSLAKKHKYGYVRVNGEGEVVAVIDRTNPHKKWDWWTVGGRYSGKLRAIGVAEPCDTCRVGDLDLDAMRGAVRVRHGEAWRQALARLAKRGIGEARARAEWAACARAIVETRAAWEARKDGSRFFDWIKTLAADHPVRVAADSGVYDAVGGYWDGIGIEEHDPDIDAWIREVPVLTTYALVRDGKWYASGDMGWWGMDTKHCSAEEWQRQVDRLLVELPADKYLAVVDCHI